MESMLDLEKCPNCGISFSYATDPEICLSFGGSMPGAQI